MLNFEYHIVASTSLFCFEAHIAYEGDFWPLSTAIS